ncbi:DHH family phosphoesterase [Aquibacillus saliphilus]|uniref:DHH family phosphoesterase n=1 Tax=Aquibacillus saliphilus TaxID=1909422 RepID=UPI001CF03B50
MPDGVLSTVMMVDYLKRHTDNVTFIAHQRSEGHGIGSDDNIPKDTDLLLILDSSSSEADECKVLSETMDIVIIDHHNLERENPYVILVNQQQQDSYPNPYSCATLLVFKFIELMDYTYNKVDTNYYLDLVALTLLSDSMNMLIPENRYFVYKGMQKINNVGLLALVNASRNQNKTLTAQIFNFDIIPVINTTTRNNEIEKAFKIMFEKDYFKAKRMADSLIKSNKDRKQRIKELMKQYEKTMQDEKFIYVVDKEATKNYNGLVAQKLSDKYKKPALVLKDNGESYQGSYRSYNGFDVQSFLKNNPYAEFAAGHPEAGGSEVKVENWDKFKQYINDNIDDELFKSVIEYDIELTEDDLTWELVEGILEFDHVYGNGSTKIVVNINNVFIHERELFPPNKPEHVKIKSDKLDLMSFNDSKYANDVGAFDEISVIGTLSINDFKKNERRIQLFIEDYRKH